MVPLRFRPFPDGNDLNLLKIGLGDRFFPSSAFSLAVFFIRSISCPFTIAPRRNVSKRQFKKNIKKKHTTHSSPKLRGGVSHRKGAVKAEPPPAVLTQP
jgi:hypothetical protein